MMAAADCTRFRSCSETVVAPAALNNHQNLAAFTTIAALTRARGGGAPMMALAARCEQRGGARQQSQVSTTAVRGLLWHRSLSGGRARGQRRACEIDLRGARPAPAACGALWVVWPPLFVARSGIDYGARAI